MSRARRPLSAAADGRNGAAGPAPVLLEPRPRASRAALVLSLLAVGLAVHYGKAVLLPVTLACFFALLLNPLLSRISRPGLPRWLGALLLLVVAVSGLGAAGTALYEPALAAAENAPRTAYRLKQKLTALTREPLQQADAVGKAMTVIEEIGGKPKTQTVALVEEADIGTTLGNLASGLATAASTLILIYLFLVYGEAGFRRAVELAPTLSDKRRTVAIVRSIQADVSRYVAAITAINIGLGLAVAGVLYLLGVEDYLLWGAMAALFNYAPYVGPMVGIVLLLAVGILQFDHTVGALAPAASYLGLNILESQLITPLILGKHFAINPPIILIWLLLWAWLWGVPGLLLAVPLLVSLKIVFSHHEEMQVWAKMLER